MPNTHLFPLATSPQMYVYYAHAHQFVYQCCQANRDHTVNNKFLNDTEIYLDAHHPDHDNSANSHKFTNKVLEMATQAIQFLICIEKILIHHHPQLCV